MLSEGFVRFANDEGVEAPPIALEQRDDRGPSTRKAIRKANGLSLLRMTELKADG